MVRYVADCLGVQFQVLIIHAAIRQVWSVQVFLRNRREENEAWISAAIILVLAGIVDELLQILFEFIYPPGPAKGFVVAEKSKNDVRFGPGEPIIRGAEVFATYTVAQF